DDRHDGGHGRVDVVRWGRVPTSTQPYTQEYGARALGRQLGIAGRTWVACRREGDREGRSRAPSRCSRAVVWSFFGAHYGSTVVAVVEHASTVPKTTNQQVVRYFDKHARKYDRQMG